MAPKTWATAKNTAMASARSSTGKVSVTVRYPALAPAEAKKNTTIQMKVWPAGASVVDPSLVQELIRARRRRDPLDVLSPREREVLALMAGGASNAGISGRIFVSEGTVEKHVRSILANLDLPASKTEHRRAAAVVPQ